MDLKFRHRNAHIAALALAAGCVPATQIMLMYFDYRLGWHVTSTFYRVTLLLALAVAVIITSSLSGSWSMKMVRVVLIGAWSYAALIFAAFMPGCMWAPACL